MQVVDLLLWGALQDHLEPASPKARLTAWCGGFRWAHVGAQFINAKYFAVTRSPALTDGHDDREPPYPVDFDALDDGDADVLANVYCLSPEFRGTQDAGWNTAHEAMAAVEVRSACTGRRCPC